MIARMRGVSKTIAGRQIIRGISLEMEEGKIYSLIGPNGSGKTTTVRLLAGIIQPTTGEIDVLGKNTQDPDFHIVRQDLGVQNDGSAYQKLTVRENLAFFLSLYGERLADHQDDLKALLADFELTPYADRPLAELSKGNRQKLLIVRALMTRPKLLIFDEPTSGLDPKLTDFFSRYIKAYAEREAATILICTHQLLGLEDYVDRIFLIYKGKIIDEGTPEELVQSQWPNILFELQLDDAYSAQDLLRSIEGVEAAEASAPDRLTVFLSERAIVPRVLSELLQKGWKVYQCQEIKHSVKDYYLKKISEVAE